MGQQLASYMKISWKFGDLVPRSNQLLDTNSNLVEDYYKLCEYSSIHPEPTDLGLVASSQ